MSKYWQNFLATAETSSLMLSTAPIQVPSSGRRNRSGRHQVRIRRRRYVFTLNNPTALDCVRLTGLLENGSDVEGAGNLSFFVVQTEKGENGTVHYQCYAEFKKSVEWTRVKAIFGPTIHVEVARANAASNIRYCTKNDTRYTGDVLCVSGQWGIPKKGGSVMSLAIKVLNGLEMDEATELYPDIMMMHGPKVEAFIAKSKGTRTWKPKITILYGLTGCGKSQYCVEHFGTKAYWVSGPDSGRVWWGHYMGQEVCVFDDFNEDWFKLVQLLHIMDSTPLWVAPKGSQVPFTSRHLVFSSNVDPRDWYQGYAGKKAHKDALERRIQDFAEIIDCTLEEEVDESDSFEMVLVRKRVKRTEVFKFREDLGMNYLNTINIFSH